MLNVAIAGAGAMGARFASMLSDVNISVTMIDKWQEHVSAINSYGLKVEDRQKNIKTYHIPAFLPEDVSQKFDLIIVFTKAMQMDNMLSSLKKIIDKNTFVLTLANGIGNIETIEKYVPQENIIAGVTVWSSELVGPGKIKITGQGSVTMQAVSSDGNKAKIKEIVDEMNKAKLNVNLADDVLSAIWRKAAFNSVLNTLTSLMDANVGEFGKTSTGMQIADQVLNEFELAANAVDVKFDKQDTQRLIQSQFGPQGNGNHYASMYQDLHNNRKTEIDYLNGYVSYLGKKYNFDTPVNTLLTDLIHAKEDLNQIRVTPKDEKVALS